MSVGVPPSLAVLATGFAPWRRATLGLVTLRFRPVGVADLRCAAPVGVSPGPSGSILLEGLLLTLPAAGIALLADDRTSRTPAPPERHGCRELAVSSCLLVFVLRPDRLLGAAQDCAGTGRRARLGDAHRTASTGGRGLGGLLAGVGASLRERGLLAASSATQLPAADPLIAAVPALAGIAAGLVALRLYPFPTRLFAAAAALRRDLVPVLAIRRATRAKGAGQILLILLATSAIGTFAAAILVSLDRSADAVAWHDVARRGGYRPVRRAFRESSTLPRLPGVQGAASVNQGAVSLGSARSRRCCWPSTCSRTSPCWLPPGPGLPPELLGAGGDPLPAIVSSGSRPRARAQAGAAAVADRGGADVPGDDRPGPAHHGRRHGLGRLPTVQVGRPSWWSRASSSARLHPGTLPRRGLPRAPATRPCRHCVPC